MEKLIKEMEKHFDQGLLRLNWTALGIPDYASLLNGEVQHFEGIVNQVDPSCKTLHKLL
jgi:hypothetical protein